MLIPIVESFGQFWSGFRFGNGSLVVIRLSVESPIAPEIGLTEPVVTAPAVIVFGDGFVQRSFLASLQSKAYGDPETWVTLVVLAFVFSTRAQTTKFTLPSPSLSNSAQASP